MSRSYVVPMRWMVIYEVPGGALNLSSTKLPRPWSPWESYPSRKNPHGGSGNRTRDLMISSQKLWPLDDMKFTNVLQNRGPVAMSCDHAVVLHIRRRMSCGVPVSVTNTGLLRGVSSRSTCYPHEVRYRRFPLVTILWLSHLYICIVYTIVLFQSLAGIYCQTQHIEY
jgi:hypothetical protein